MNYQHHQLMPVLCTNRNDLLSQIIRFTYWWMLTPLFFTVGNPIRVVLLSQEFIWTATHISALQLPPLLLTPLFPLIHTTLRLPPIFHHCHHLYITAAALVAQGLPPNYIYLYRIQYLHCSCTIIVDIIPWKNLHYLP